MDWKAGISFLSAVVAVVSAILAYRAKIQTRADIFESQRDALILAMADNDNRCSHLVLQAAIARKELESILPKLSDEETRADAAGLLRNIADIEQLTQSLNGREYNQKNLDQLKYSEDSLTVLRRMARGEQLNAKHLAAETYNLVFEHIKRLISRYED